MMMKGTMNLLTNYTPSITILPESDQTDYTNIVRNQLTPEIIELLIDITVEFDTEIIESLSEERLKTYLKLCSILDGE